MSIFTSSYARNAYERDDEIAILRKQLLTCNIFTKGKGENERKEKR